MAEPIIGQTLLERYYVEAFIASGGMGAVFRVKDLHRNTYLAMKMMHADLADDPSIFRRFQREANALKDLNHPNIVRFYGLYQALDFAFILQDLIDGFSLQDLLKQKPGKRLSVKESLTVLKSVGNALGFAHTNKMVHCDVKPGNVLVDHGGKVYLTDFGIARHADSTTTTMATAGAPAYMAPEQILGKAVTAATDVYALGVMMYEILAGRRPFLGNESSTSKASATSAERLRSAHLRLTPPDPRQFNPQIPAGLATAVLCALEKDPKKRFQSTRDFFNEACAGVNVPPESVPDLIRVPKPQTATQTNPITPPIKPEPDYTPSPFTPTPPRSAAPTTNPMLYAGLAAVAFFIIIAIIIGNMGGSRSSSPSRSTASSSSSNSSSSSSASTPKPAKAPTSTPRLMPTTTAEKCWAESRENNVNLRARNGGIIGCCLAKGEDVDVTGYMEGGWYYITRRSTGKSGYVSEAYLTLQGNCDDIYD